MTTIATDGVTIAADGQRTAGSERIGLNAKKIIVRDGRIFALTGTVGLFEAAIRWFLAGAEAGKAPKGAEEDSWRLIVIDKTGALATFGSTALFGEPFPYPQAFGSGANYAMAAMRCGKSPQEAVEIAKELDVLSGGLVQVVNIAEAIGLPRLRAAVA
jgi:ATP-dependent protease HslVU (ClpYQ) peptidase subunit